MVVLCFGLVPRSRLPHRAARRASRQAQRHSGNAERNTAAHRTAYVRRWLSWLEHQLKSRNTFARASTYTAIRGRNGTLTVACGRAHRATEGRRPGDTMIAFSTTAWGRRETPYITSIRSQQTNAARAYTMTMHHGIECIMMPRSSDWPRGRECRPSCSQLARVSPWRRDTQRASS